MPGDEDIPEEAVEARIFQQDSESVSARYSVPVERLHRYPGHRYTQEPSRDRAVQALLSTQYVYIRAKNLGF